MVAHPGAPELPIAKGASGGELSRVMLALEVVLADADPVATMVFDEVDAGVGGRAATEIGSRLAAWPGPPGHRRHPPRAGRRVRRSALRRRRVDRRAGRYIRRAGGAGRDREVELARMLGGTNGATARAHAANCCAAARPRRRVARSSAPLGGPERGRELAGADPADPTAIGNARHGAAPTALSPTQLSRSVHEASVTSVTRVTRSHRSRAGVPAQRHPARPGRAQGHRGHRPRRHRPGDGGCAGQGRVTGVVNAAPSISGRYPNLGPEILVDSGVILIDGVGEKIFGRLKDGAKIRARRRHGLLRRGGRLPRASSRPRNRSPI